MQIKAYRIKIVRDGYEFEAEGDKTFVLEMLKRFSPEPWIPSGAKPKERLNGKGGGKEVVGITPLSPGKSISIREFIQQLGFSKHIDIAVAFGFYLEKYARMSEFSAADINNCYYESKLESSNTSLMILRNIKRGYMMASKSKEEKGRKRYTLTNSGEQFIRSKLESKP
jgi:predicted transcriptional regulator